MDSTTAALSHQVFGPTKRTADRIRSTAEGIIEVLKVYTWPRNIPSDHKLAVLAYMTAHGRSVDDSPSAWASWTISYVILCFPEIGAALLRLNGREFKEEILPQKYIESILRVYNAALDFDSSEPANYDEPVSRIEAPANFPNLQITSESYPPELAPCAVVHSIYGYCSLLIYLAGKQINERNSIAITEKRPKNLIDAYRINEIATYILIGDGKIGQEGHHAINQVWTTYSHARAAVITEVAAFVSGASLPQRVVYTITKLLEHSGMQPATFIFRFLQARPEVREFSCTKAALNAFASSVREVAAAPDHLQPYYKLIYGESTRAFHRNSLLILSACATANEKLTSPSMRNFDLGEGATACVNLFDAEAASRGYATLSSVSTSSAEQGPTID